MAVNAFKAMLPFQRQLRGIKRAIIPEQLTHHHQLVVDGILEQICEIENLGQKIEGAVVLEIGSGWQPIAPLIYRAAGASKVYMCDQHHLVRLAALHSSLDFVRARTATIASTLGIDEALIIRRLSLSGSSRNLQTTLSQLSLDYMVPFDPRRIEGLVDIAFSHTVLEHISKSDLEAIFKDIHTVLKPDGVISSGIDNSDHRYLYDDTLSRIDFLRYPESKWVSYCRNDQDFTNRLRHSDYLRLLTAAGYKICFEKKFICETSKRDLHDFPLDQQFTHYSDDDLSTLWSLIIGRAIPHSPSIGSNTFLSTC